MLFRSFFKKHNSHLSFTYTFFVRFAIFFRATISGVYRINNKALHLFKQQETTSDDLLVITSKINKDKIVDLLDPIKDKINNTVYFEEKIAVNDIENLIANNNITDIIFDDLIYSNKELISLFEQLGDRGLTFSIFNNTSGVISSPGLKFYTENA